MKLAFNSFAIALSVCLVHNVVGSPIARDDTAVVSEQLPVHSVVPEKHSNEGPPRASHENVVIPGRVWCQHAGEAPIEDQVCQRHCLPKGYSYGLCVTNTCSCI